MPLKRVSVLGKQYRASALCAKDVRPEALVYFKNARKAYRIVAEDGTEMILRNMRHPDMLDAVTPEWICENCYLIEPCE